MRSEDDGAIRRRALHIVVAPEARPPFEVDAVAVEDDTYSVLGADPEFREPTEHPIRIWTEVHEMVPASPGSVAVVGGHPLQLRAVVHDLSQDPTWREEWIRGSLIEILRVVGRRGIRSLGLPILGAVHGRLQPDRFVALLREALGREMPEGLERLWLISRAEDASRLEGLVRDRG